jgi:cellulase/cellobiase CelA1
VCVGGECAASDGIATSTSGLVQAAVSVTTDWGAGYCAVLHVINNAQTAALTWSVDLNIQQATTYTTWNGTFSGSSGIVNVAPSQSFNQTIAAGKTDASIGFCANRTAPGSGAQPLLLGATGTF